jgi:peptidoglycan hydrolase-like protein with peptidoglycan-binding domain
MARVVAGLAVVALTLLAGCGPSTTGAATTATSVAAAPSTPSASPSTSESSTTPSASAPSASTPTPSPTATQTTPEALTAGPAIYHSGDTGDAVRDLQVRMRQLAWYSGRITGTYDAQTVTGIQGFQGKRGFPVTGEVDQRTMDKLRSMTRTPTAGEKNNVTPAITATGAIDPRCLTGHVLCIDKSTRKLRWMVDGQVVKVFDVRFGSELTPTREGSFTVSTKSRNQVSTLYHTAMPFAMFFSGGQAVHYSADFAARGYNGASHGCINVRDYNGIAWLFDQVSIGNAVIVYRS